MGISGPHCFCFFQTYIAAVLLNLNFYFLKSCLFEQSVAFFNRACGFAHIEGNAVFFGYFLRDNSAHKSGVGEGMKADDSPWFEKCVPVRECCVQIRHPNEG